MMEEIATIAAAASGGLAGLAVVAAVSETEVASRLAGLAAEVARLSFRVLVRGEAVTGAEGRMVTLMLAAAAMVAGFLAVGSLVGVAMAVLMPWMVKRIAAWRLQRHRREFERQVPELAIALANALAAGHSIRGAVLQVASEMDGVAGAEMERTAMDVALGSPTEVALTGLRGRVRSRQLDVLVAAMTVQRKVGGDLARLLREVARAAENRLRLAEEVRTATAQARFTGKMVVGMPVVTVVAVAVIDPALLTGILETPVSLWLIGPALAMQVVGLALIRRIARVDAR